jgi:hypothetical protein
VGWCTECVTTQQENVNSLLPSFIHSFLIVSQEKSLASFKASFPNSAIYCFLRPLSSILFYFRSSYRCSCLLLRLSVTSKLPSFFHAISSSIRQLLSDFWTIIYTSSLAICNTSSFPTQLNKLSFSVRLQHHSAMLSSYFCSASCSVQCSAP